jgi:hypothetical protein
VETFFLRQPNGKLALFSPTISKFTFSDMTEVEALEYAQARWGDTAIEKVRDAIDDAPLGQQWETSDGLNRWRWTLTYIARAQGIDGLNYALDMIGLPDEDIPQSALDAALSAARQGIR